MFLFHQRNMSADKSHQVLRVGHCVVVFGGFYYQPEGLFGSVGCKYYSYHEISAYNLYTEEWQKIMIPQNETVPSEREKACAVVVGKAVYMFGGEDTTRRGCMNNYTNDLWTLQKTQHGSFGWNKINRQSKDSSPSPRSGHSGWTYKGNLWFFGGEGSSPTGYLNSHRREFFPGILKICLNKQLLRFKPSEQNWTCVQSFGAIPSQRVDHAAAVMEGLDKAWVYGGYSFDRGWKQLNDVHELDLSSITWTLIETSLPGPLVACSFNAVGETKLVLNGHIKSFELPQHTWILDLTSMSWRHWTSEDRCTLGLSHTGCNGLNNSVIFVDLEADDEDNSPQNNDKHVFNMMLEPKTLQQVATRMIHKYKHELPWQSCLPNQLLATFSFIWTVNE